MVYVLNECLFVTNIAGKMSLGYGENNVTLVINTGYGDIELSVAKNRIGEQANSNAAQCLALSFIYRHGKRQADGELSPGPLEWEGRII